MCHIAGDNKEPSIGAHLQWGGHVHNWGSLLSTLYAVWVVPILAPNTIAWH